MSTVNIVHKKTEESSWFDLRKRIREEGSNKVFNIGDVVEFKLKNDKTITMEVAELNVYGENTVVFVSQDCVLNDIAMNWENEYGCKGAWANCKMQRYLNNSFLNLLPQDLVDIIIPRKIKQSVFVQEYDYTYDKEMRPQWFISKEEKEVFESDNLLWIPSVTELFGSFALEKDIDMDDVHFSLFKDDKSRVKFFDDETVHYPTRTPYSKELDFCRSSIYYVGIDGELTTFQYADVRTTIVIGFIIG